MRRFIIISFVGIKNQSSDVARNRGTGNPTAERTNDAIQFIHITDVFQCQIINKDINNQSKTIYIFCI